MSNSAGDRLLELTRPAVRALSAYQVPQLPDIEVKLDANEHPHPLPPEIATALGEELATVPLHRYPPIDGGELREILVDELDVSASGLVLGNGSDELIQVLCATFAHPRPGRSEAVVVSPTPSFGVFAIAAAANGARLVETPLSPDFQLDWSELERTVTESDASIVFLARPNNPTGTLWAANELTALARRLPHVLFVSDEAYGDYATGSALPHLSTLPNLIVMRTLSKMGLAALRVGFLCASAELCAEVDKVRGPYNIGALNLRAATWLLKNHRDHFKDHCRQVVSERQRVNAALASIEGVQPFASDANFVLFRVGSAGDGRATELWNSLVQRRILVRCFDRPGPLSGCLRVTIGTARENDRFLAALADDWRA